MSLLALLHVACLALVAALLVGAGAQDLRSMQIANGFSLAIAGLFVVWATVCLVGGQMSLEDLALAVGCGVAVFGGGVVAFALGALGGGDRDDVVEPHDLHAEHRHAERLRDPVERRLGEVAELTAKSERALRNRANGLLQKLDTIEKVMVDPQRKSVRDVLRNPAGLNDTLFDMIAMTTTADMAPTEQTKDVSREVMAKVDSEVAKFEALVEGDIAQLDKALAKARIRHIAIA